MTITIQTTDIIVGSGAAFTFASADDAIWVRAGVTVASTGGDCIRGTVDNTRIVLDGSIVAENIGIHLDGTGHSVTIGETGTIDSFRDSTTGFGGIFFADGGSSLVNFGRVSASEGHAVASRGTAMSISNHGLISGGNNGITLVSSDSSILNTGQILAGLNTFSLPFDGDSHAISVSAAGAKISNSGLLHAVQTDGAGIGFDANVSNARIDNTGDIISMLGYGIDFGAASASAIDILTFNTGTISGSDGSYLGFLGAETVINRGLMVGDIEMADGADLYYGRYGSVEGDILLGAGDDTASGGAEGERIEGGDGIDRIFGFGGDDNLFGDAGNDVLRGGDGDDGVNGGADNDDLGGGAGDDTLLGADGNDLLRGDLGADVLNGGDGFDRASYRDSSEAIYFDLADMGQSSGIAQGDSFVSIEAYEATDFDDYMLGDDVNNLLRGMDGDDSLYGRGGNDNLQGFDDDDFLAGGTGNDTLNGGDGTDTAYFEGNQADFTFTLLGNGNIRVEDTVGDNGVDVLVSIELVSFFDASSVDVTGLI